MEKTRLTPSAVCLSFQEAEMQSEPFLSEHFLAECGSELGSDGIL